MTTFTQSTPVRPTGSGVGELLREWRRRRGLSQLELALRADSAARHISFVETGRSRPSETMIMRLADQLDVPVRDRNVLLVAAGYAPVYHESSWDAPDHADLRASLERLLTAYEPYPALVVDGSYTVLAANRGIGLLIDGLPERLVAPPLNALRLALHPEGLASRTLNLAEWREHLLEQIRRQISQTGSPVLAELHEEVAGYPPPAHPAAPPAADADVAGVDRSLPGPSSPCVALPLRMSVRGRELSFISSIATFNTPLSVTVAELAVETFLPADPETADHLRELLG
ncbi:helix-turn-helix domain-containing protein [Streptomyces sp. BI20]|uniref:helix-turn-helix domain-containing protein n=1 Tax=Streptomyces sp. BI20 TaxID=3403460 RepID=UPI003C7829E0